MRATLGAIVGDEWVSEPVPPFDDVDGVHPRLLVSPGGAAEVAEVLRTASREGWAVLPTGRGRLRTLGNPPRGGDLWLSTERLTAVTEYEPADLTAAVQSGATLGEFNRHLAEHRQVLPWDPPGGPDRTMGGIAAVGKTGPLRLGFGQPRDWVLGIEVATVEGKLIRAGGRVVKNVAGYDLTKLFVGSLGTLGVITELNVKVRPQPATELTTVVASRDPSMLWSLARKIRQSHAQPVAMEILSAEAMRWAGTDVAGRDDYLCTRFAGDDADVRDQVLLVESFASELGLSAAEQIGDQRVLALWRGIADLPLHEAVRVALRLSLRLSRLKGVAGLATRSFPVHAEEVAVCVGPGTGTLWVFLGGVVDEHRITAIVPEIERLREICRADGGSLVIERAPLELKKRLDVWGDVGSAGPLMKGMKKLFDPHDSLNPGRFVAGM